MTRSRRRLVLALALGLTLIALTLGGCSMLKPPAPRDLLAEYRPGLRPDIEIEPSLLSVMPRYSITVRIEPATGLYTGTMEVTVPITGNMPRNDFYFRLYPNLPQFGGALEVRAANVNGSLVNYAYEAAGTAFHLSWPKPLPVGEDARVWLSFNGKTEQRKPGLYTIFGANESVLSLTNFYPILAGRREEGWALDIASPLGDVGFHDAALYRVEATMPAGSDRGDDGRHDDRIAAGWLGDAHLCARPGARIHLHDEPALPGRGG